jgi:hypothetical protein
VLLSTSLACIGTLHAPTVVIRILITEEAFRVFQRDLHQELEEPAVGASNQRDLDVPIAQNLALTLTFYRLRPTLQAWSPACQPGSG